MTPVEIIVVLSDFKKNPQPTKQQQQKNHFAAGNHVRQTAQQEHPSS